MESETLTARELAARTPASRDRYVDLLRVLYTGLLTVATRLVAQPLWFVGVYLAMVAFAPLNFLLVWLAVHQLGFFYADGRIGRRAARAMAGGGLAAALALVAYGPYPVSMVGMPGEQVSNMAPPTPALLAHAVWLAGLAMLLRGPVTRLLARPRVWLAVVATNGLAMTASLWHLSAVFVLGGLQLVLGLRQPPVGTPAWWLMRPLWLASLAGVSAGLLMVFRRADRPRAAVPGPRAPAGRSPGWCCA